MKEYFVGHLFEECKVGEELNEMPLHLTVLHWVNLDSTPDRVCDALSRRFKGIGQITTCATVRDNFGPNNNIPVTRLEKTEALTALHGGAIKVVKEHGVEIDENWAGIDKWSPHVTDTNTRCLVPGSEIVIPELSIVVKNGHGMAKTLLGTFNL